MARVNGTVKFFNHARGFGFIQPEDGGKDVFVHATALERSGVPALNEGDKVSFEIEDDNAAAASRLPTSSSPANQALQDSEPPGIARRLFLSPPRPHLTPRGPLFMCRSGLTCDSSCGAILPKIADRNSASSIPWGTSARRRRAATNRTMTMTNLTFKAIAAAAVIGTAALTVAPPAEPLRLSWRSPLPGWRRRRRACGRHHRFGRGRHHRQRAHPARGLCNAASATRPITAPRPMAVQSPGTPAGIATAARCTGRIFDVNSGYYQGGDGGVYFCR